MSWRAAIAVVGLVSAIIAPACADEGVDSACGRVELSDVPPKRLDHLFQGFHGIATDGAFVYYPTAADGELHRIPIGGEKKPELVRAQPYIRAIKAHGTRVCWMFPDGVGCLDASQGPSDVVKVERYPRDSWSYFRDFDFDETHVYWLDEHALWRAPLDRSAPPSTLATTAETTRAIAVGGGRIVFGTEDFSSVSTCRTADGCSASNALVSYGRPPQAILGSLATDGRFAYVPIHLADDTGRRGGRLVRVDLDTGEKRDLVSCLDESPVAVEVDGSTAILLTHATERIPTKVDSAGQPLAGGSVWSIPLDGSMPRRLANEQPHPVHAALLPDRVFWINDNDRRGELMVLAR